MKKSVLLLALLITTVSAMSQAKSGAIKTRPISLAFGVVNAEYEKAFGEKSSGQLGATIVSTEFSSTKLSGFGVRPEYRFYSQEALRKFYWGPVLNYNSFTAKIEDAGFLTSESTVTTIGGGLKIGWDWLLGSSENIVLDLGIGAQYLSSSFNVKAGEEDDFDLGFFEGIVPILNFSIGYAFD